MEWPLAIYSTVQDMQECDRDAHLLTCLQPAAVKHLYICLYKMDFIKNVILTLGIQLTISSVQRH